MRSVLIGITTFIVLLLGVLAALSQDLEPPLTWDVKRDDPAPYQARATRGETIKLRPRLMDGKVPANLAGATVTFRRSIGGSNDFTGAGAIVDATQGMAEVTIDTSSNYPASRYGFEIAVGSSSSTMIRAFGSLQIVDDVLFGSSPTPLAAGVADPMAVPYVRTVDRLHPVAWMIPARRGETLSIQPCYVDDDVPVDLSHAYTAWFRYRGLSSTNGYVIPCEFANRTNGQLQAVWSPANELADSTYLWDIIVSGATSSMIRAFGSLTLAPSIGYVNPTNRPTTLSLLDMATVQIVNIGAAPWLSSYEIDDVRRYIAGLEDGTAALDVGSLTIGGVPILPVVNLALTNVTVSGYGSLTRTGPHTAALTITGDGGGGGSGGGGGIGSYTNTQINGINQTNSVRIGDGTNVTWSLGTDGVWRATAIGDGTGNYTNTQINGANNTNTIRIGDSTNVTWSLGTDGVWRALAIGDGVGTYTNTQINGVNHPSAVRIGDSSSSSWSIGTDGVWRISAGLGQSWASTGSLFWVVDGVQIGRIDSNGITMLHGSLQLQEQDLNCNVRIYDGSRTAPCLTPYGHPNTIGMYVRGYMGSWGFGFSHAGTDILTINAGGLTLLSTNAAIIGRFIGDLSNCTNYPEPLFYAYKTNKVYDSFTIQTNGVLNMQHSPFNFDAIVLNASNSTASFYDGNQTKRVNVDGNNGIITLRDSGGSLKWEANSANSFFSGVRTQFTVNAARTITVTNVITYVYGAVTSFTQQ